MSELRRFAVEDGSDITNLVSGLQHRASFQRDPDQVVERTVYDTFDWRLHAERTVLEHDRVVVSPRSRRAAPEPWLVWRSSDTGEVLGRLPVADVPAFAWDLPDVPTAERLAGVLEMRALRPLVTVRTERVTLRLVDAEGKTEARVVIDQAELIGLGRHADGGLAPTVEVIPVRGYPRAADRVTALLSAQVVLHPVERDTVHQALEQAGYTPGDYSSKLHVRLDPDASALDAVVSVLSTLLLTMERNEPGTRDDTDSEFLHDYRVAVRRSRSVLGMAKGVVPGALLDHLRAEFKWLGDITTPTRDFDVYRLTYPDFEASLPQSIQPDLHPLRDYLDTHQRLAHDELVRQLDSPRYAALLTRYRAWLAHPTDEVGATDPEVAPDAAVDARTFAAARTWRAYRSIVRDGRRITDDTPPRRSTSCARTPRSCATPSSASGACSRPTRWPRSSRSSRGCRTSSAISRTPRCRRPRCARSASRWCTSAARQAAPALLAMGYLIEQLDERERGARDRFADRFASFDAHHNRQRFRRLFAPPPPGDRPMTTTT